MKYWPKDNRRLTREIGEVRYMVAYQDSETKVSMQDVATRIIEKKRILRNNREKNLADWDLT
jgi:hypothetical protein